MANYAKTEVTDLITVHSIVTVHCPNLTGRIPEGEAHDFPEIIYVEQGSYTVLVDGVIHALKENQLLICAPNAYHCDLPCCTAYEPTIGIISFETHASAAETLYNRIYTLNANQRELFSKAFSMGLHIFERINSRSGMVGMTPRAEAKEYELQHLKNLLELLLLSLYQESRTKIVSLQGSNRENYKQLQLDALTVYLKEHLGQVLTLEQMSEGIGISVSKLRRLTAQLVGCGPAAYHLSLKIEEAKRMIRQTSLNMTQISDQLGFSSVHYFSKQFKDKTGKTPTAYSKSIDQR